MTIREGSDAGSRGGIERAKRLSADERREIARKAARARWERVKQLNTPDVPPSEMPTALYRGTITLLGSEIPCYVLDSGQHVVGRLAVTEMLTGIKRQGDFESYITANSLKPYIDSESIGDRMVSFRIPETDSLKIEVKGLPDDVLLEVCSGLMKALEANSRPDSGVKLTPRQQQIAMQAGLFLAALPSIGLMALIDEATGYQYARAQDALQVTLHAFLENEMRKWEKTFPDELWLEFGRLTGWKGPVHLRPKYWGHLVNELVYNYLDSDVAQWLRDNAPKPRHGQNYHQWLSSQFGLQKLVEHIWKLIGIAKTCENMTELKEKMALIHGRYPVQFRMYLPAPSKN